MYDDFLTRVLEPDTVLPQQFYGKRSVSGHMEGERRLMLAILQDAVECLEKYRRSKNSIHRELYQDALKWVQDSNTRWLFCFNNVCDFLGFDPEYLRQFLIGREHRTTKLDGSKASRLGLSAS
jgi:hypothetical protein